MPGGLDDPWGPFFTEPYHQEAVVRFCEEVYAYRDKVLEAGVAGANSDFCLSIEEWLERAKAWREAYPELCKDPTF